MISFLRILRIGTDSLARSAQTLRLFPPRAEKKPNPPAPIVSAQQTIRNAWDRAGGYLNKWLPEKSPEKSG